MDSNGLWVSPYLWAPYGVLPAHPAQRDVTLLQFWVHLPLYLGPGLLLGSAAPMSRGRQGNMKGQGQLGAAGAAAVPRIGAFPSAAPCCWLHSSACQTGFNLENARMKKQHNPSSTALKFIYIFLLIYHKR